MPTVIGPTGDGKHIVRHDPSEGCRWRCTTCGNYLRGRSEVWGHWMRFNEGHSIFQKTSTGRMYHQTVEGLFRRNWEMLTQTGLLATTAMVGGDKLDTPQSGSMTDLSHVHSQSSLRADEILSVGDTQC